MNYCKPMPYYIRQISCKYPVAVDPLYYIKNKAKKDLSYYPQRIINTVCSHFNLSEFSVKKKTRIRIITDARSICMFLIHKYLPTITIVDIGKMFGKHHTTVLYSIQKVYNLLETDKDVLVDYKALCIEINCFI